LAVRNIGPEKVGRHRSAANANQRYRARVEKLSIAILIYYPTLAKNVGIERRPANNEWNVQF
jgi:hypothetical protein